MFPEYCATLGAMWYILDYYALLDSIPTPAEKRPSLGHIQYAQPHENSE